MKTISHIAVLAAGLLLSGCACVDAFFTEFDQDQQENDETTNLPEAEQIPMPKDSHYIKGGFN